MVSSHRVDKVENDKVVLNDILRRESVNYKRNYHVSSFLTCEFSFYLYLCFSNHYTGRAFLN